MIEDRLELDDCVRPGERAAHDAEIVQIDFRDASIVSADPEVPVDIYPKPITVTFSDEVLEGAEFAYLQAMADEATGEPSGY